MKMYYGYDLFPRSFKVSPYSKSRGPVINVRTSQPDSKQKNTFYNNMKPVIMLMKVLGIFPYNVRDTGELQFRLVSGTVLYSVLVQVAMFFLTGLLVLDRVYAIMQQQASFIEHLVDGAFVFVLLPVFLVPATHWLEITKMLQFINSWVPLQADYTRVTLKEFPINLRRRAVFMLGIVAVVLVVLELDAFLVIRGLQKWWHGIPFGFSVILCAVLPFNWTSCCSGLILMARDIGNHLETHFPDQLEQHRRLWLRLSLQTQDLGQCCGFTYGAQNVVFFSVQIIAFYALLSQMSQSFAVTHVVFASAGFVFSGLLHLQCNAAHIATAEVGVNFQERLEDVALRFGKTSNSLKHDVKNFLETITLNPPTINYCGFVNVNRGLLTSFLSATVTYLVVLTQFQMSTPEDLRGHNFTNITAAKHS